MPRSETTLDGAPEPGFEFKYWARILIALEQDEVFSMDYSAEAAQRGTSRQMRNARGVVLALVWGMWQLVRWPLLTLLILLEPIFRGVLASLALLGTLTAFLFGALRVPHFPFWGMLATSLSCGGLLIAYYGVIRALSRH